MKQKVFLWAFTVIFCLGITQTVKASLYKNESKEKKELSGNSSISSLFREDDGFSGGGTGFDLLYPNDDLPEGPPIGVPVDESVSVCLFMLTIALAYVAIKKRTAKVNSCD
jgi:hypothetical protein